jgi:hypothetical protein
MKGCIITAEGRLGSPQTQQLAFAKLEIVAGQLLPKFNKAVVKLYGDNPEEMRIFSNISERIASLIDKRNDVIHRTWFVEAGSEGEEFSKAPSWKFKKTKNGPEFKPKVWKVGDFDEPLKEAKELADIVFRLDACLVIGRPLSKNFRIEDGIVRLRGDTDT